MPHVRFTALLPLVLFALGAGCGGSSDSTTPTIPTIPTVTETFTGSINPNGAAIFPFATQASGQVTATLTLVSPDSTVRLGFSLGTWNGVACQIVIAPDSAVQGAVLIGNATSAGSLCVRIYDAGALTENTSFEFTVQHPGV